MESKAKILGILLLAALVARSYLRGPCDPLTPDYCQLPLPNSFFTRADATSPTGLRVNLSADTLPKDTLGRGVDPVHWNTMGERWREAAALVYVVGSRAMHC